MERLRAHVSLNCNDFHTSYCTLTLIGTGRDWELGIYASVLTPEIDLFYFSDTTTMSSGFVPNLMKFTRMFAYWRGRKWKELKKLIQKQNLG
jgi:hypothetical protein